MEKKSNVIKPGLSNRNRRHKQGGEGQYVSLRIKEGALESLRKNKTADRCTGTEGSTDCNSITDKHKQNIHTNIKSDNTTIVCIPE